MRMTCVLLSLGWFLVTTPLSAQSPKLSTEHDGTWAVVLTCEDHRDGKGLAKGYTLSFPVTITAGRVEGQYKGSGSSGELRYVGEVREGGELVLRAQGATGAPDYTVNRVQPGTQYGYSLRGRLDKDSGQAKRMELRACLATFSRKS